jgi:hypothetical protein
VHFGILPYFAKPKGGPILVRHCDEGWRLHQPADCGKVVPRKWHAAVWTANLADCASPPDEREGTMITSTPNHQYHHQISRRGIIIGAAASLICAPAIVRVTSLMSVRRLPFPFGPQSAGFIERLKYDFLARTLMSGWDDKRHGPVVGGISENHAIRAVAYAQEHGFLPR